MSSRMMAVVGLLMTITATLLMGDWQSLRHDPCNEASLFHHPDLLHTYTTQLDHLSSYKNHTKPHITDTTSDQLSTADIAGIECERLNLSLTLKQLLNSSTLNIYVYPNIVTGDVMSYGCEVVDSCPYCSLDRNDELRTYLATPTCLRLHVNSQQQCLERTSLLPWQQEPHPLSTSSSYLCTTPKSHFTYCLQLASSGSSESAAIQEEEEEEEQDMLSDLHRQSVQIVEGHVGLLAYRACRDHPAGTCHWNPTSSLTHRHCEECPAICRHRSNYLEFSQFVIAAALMLVSVPVARVPITSIISDLVNPDQQVSSVCCMWWCSLMSAVLSTRESSWDLHRH